MTPPNFESLLHAFENAVRDLAMAEARHCARGSQRIEVNTTRTSVISHVQAMVEAVDREAT